MMRALPLVLLALVLPLPALAHPGDGLTYGFAAGVVHPLAGPDHVLAMIALGIWAGLAGGRAIWLLPAGFLTGMAIGGVLGMAGSALPMVEAGILGSIITLGVLVAAAARPMVVVALALVGAFGLLHGHAHGTELAEGSSGLGYAAGFLLATAALHGAGLLLAWQSGTGPGRVALRVAGATTAVLGLGMVILG